MNVKSTPPPPLPASGCVPLFSLETKAPELELYGIMPQGLNVPSISGSPGALYPPATTLCPSTQARKGRGPAEKPFNPMEFSKSRARFRNWALGVDGTAGAWGRDEIRNAEGHFAVLPMPGSAGYNFYGDGLWKTDTSKTTVVASSGSVSPGNYLLPKFAFSNAVPTGPMNVPPHIWQPVIIYLGRPR